MKDKLTVIIMYLVLFIILLSGIAFAVLEFLALLKYLFD